MFIASLIFVSITAMEFLDWVIGCMRLVEAGRREIRNWTKSDPPDAATEPLGSGR